MLSEEVKAGADFFAQPSERHFDTSEVNEFSGQVQVYHSKVERLLIAVQEILDEGPCLYGNLRKVMEGFKIDGE